MTKTIKRYQLLQGMQLMTFFLVNGNAVSVTFQHGIRRPELIRGWFSTDSPELQEAIESDKGYGTLYTCVHQDIGDEVIEPASDDVNVHEDNGNIPEPLKAEAPAQVKKADPDATDYPEVLLLKDARQKLLDLFPEEIKLSQIPNKQAILKKAKEKNITFSKLV